MPLDAFSPSVPFKQKLLQMLDLHRAECSLDYTSPRKSAKVTERTQPFCSHKSCLNTLPAWAILLALIKQQGKLLLWQRTKPVWTVVRLWKVWAIMTLPPPPPPSTHLLLPSSRSTVIRNKNAILTPSPSVAEALTMRSPATVFSLMRPVYGPVRTGAFWLRSMLTVSLSWPT